MDDNTTIEEVYLKLFFTCKTKLRKLAFGIAIKFVVRQVNM